MDSLCHTMEETDSYDPMQGWEQSFLTWLSDETPLERSTVVCLLGAMCFFSCSTAHEECSEACLHHN